MSRDENALVWKTCCRIENTLEERIWSERNRSTGWIVSWHGFGRRDNMETPGLGKFQILSSDRVRY